MKVVAARGIECALKAELQRDRRSRRTADNRPADAGGVEAGAEHHMRTHQQLAHACSIEAPARDVLDSRRAREIERDCTACWRCLRA